MKTTDVILVGAGASGIGAAIKLRHTDLVVLEKADEVGGTWRDNTYPGCACDVPSALYSYSFAPNPDWSCAFASQPEILDYLRRIATEHGITERIRFGVEVHRAQWDEAAQRWQLETSDGDYQAKVLVGATGPWHEPLIPAGLGAFDGPSFHSSRWDHDVDLTGKRVAVIGTGASAVQFVPRIAPKVAELHLSSAPRNGCCRNRTTSYRPRSAGSSATSPPYVAPSGVSSTPEWRHWGSAFATRD